MSDPEPEPPPPKKRRTFLGPANAAPMGAWAALSSAFLAFWAWFAVSKPVFAGPSGGWGPATAVAVCFCFFLVAPAAAVGWVGGAVVRWLQRRRATTWPVWRAEFAGGFAAGTLLAMGVGWLIAVSRS